MAPLPKYNSYQACAVFENSIYVSGGASAANKVWKYTKGELKSDKGQWEAVGDLNVDRWAHAMGVMDGKLMVAGGYHKTKRIPTDSIETMDENGKWTKMPYGLSHPVYYTTSTCVPANDFPCK